MQEDSKESSILERIGFHTYNFKLKEDCLRAIGDDNPATRLIALESLRSFKDLPNLGAVAHLAKKDGNLAVRKAAIQVLGASGSRGAFEPLLEILMEGSPQLIADVISALLALGDPKALYYVKKIHGELESDELRQSIAHLVKRMEEALEPLLPSDETVIDSITVEHDREYLEILLGSMEPGEDERPLQYLREALSGDSDGAAARLTELLTDRDEKTRLRTVRALSHIPFSQAVKEALLPALRDASDSVRYEAVHTLLRIKDPDLPLALFDSIGDSNPLIYQEISRYLLESSNVQLIQKACETLDSSDSTLRFRAASFLAKTDNESVMPLLIGILQDSSQPPELVSEIIGALKPKRAQYVGRALPLLLKKGDKNILKSLATFFKKVNDPNLYGVLRRNLASGDPRVRHGAAFLVGQAQDGRSLQSIIGLLDDPYDSIKIQAGWSIAHMSAVQAFDQVLAVYRESRDLKVRKAFLEILSKLDIQRTLPLLLRAVEDTSPEIRYHAAQILGLYTGDEKEKAISALQGCLKDEDLRVIFTGIDSLMNLGAESFDVPEEDLAGVLKAYLYDRRQAPMFRIQAVSNIVRLLKEKSLEILLDLLSQSDDDKLLAHITETLSSFDDPLVLKKLTALLDSENSFMRKKAAHILCLKEHPEAIPYLLSFLERSAASDNTKFYVTMVLVIEYLNRMISAPLGADTENSLIQLLKHKALPVRLMAAFHLAYGGSRQIIGPFIRILKSPFHSLHYIAAFGMARFGDRRSIPILETVLEDRETENIRDSKERVKLRKDLTKYYGLLFKFNELDDESEDPQVIKKVLALRLLGAINDIRSRKALEKSVSNKNHRISEEAIRALCAIADETTVPLLLEMREQKTEFATQSTIDAALRKFRDDTRMLLRVAIESPLREKRAAAARTFAEVRGLATLYDLLTPLNDEYWLVRYWVISAIALMKDKSTELINPLVEKLKDPSPLIRSGALYALISLQSPRYREFITGAIRDPHFLVRTEATKIAGGFRLKELEGMLLNGLTDESTSVRAASCRALGETGSQSAVDSLRKIAGLRTNQEKIWAIYALCLLTKEYSAGSLTPFLAESDSENPEEILSYKSGKATNIKYYSGVFKKLGELGFRASPLLFREEYEELKRGNHELLLRFVKSLDKIYVEKISEQKENQYQAVEALGALGTGEAIAALGEVMASPREKILRLAVLRALGAIGSPDAFRAALSGLKDSSHEIYTKTAKMLKKARKEFIDSSVLPYLMKEEIQEAQRISIFTLLGLR
jgi:HEAT repeat protein